MSLPGGTRIPNLTVRSRSLYPIELQGEVAPATGFEPVSQP